MVNIRRLKLEETENLNEFVMFVGIMQPTIDQVLTDCAPGRLYTLTQERGYQQIRVENVLVLRKNVKL